MEKIGDHGGMVIEALRVIRSISIVVEGEMRDTAEFSRKCT